MIELVFVIVVIGIIAALALPRLDRDVRQEATENLLSAIRYTQHLALTDNKTDPSDANWQREFWQIRFNTDTDNLANFYTVFSDSITVDDDVQKEEAAIDPINGKYMFNADGDTIIDADESPNIFIGKKYGINSMTFSGGCAGTEPQHIAFDNWGRPHNGLGTATNNYNRYMTSDCTIIMGFADTSIQDLNITIAAETGYVTID